MVAPGLRRLLRFAALCKVVTVNIPILLHLYLIVGIDRSPFRVVESRAE